MIKKYLEFIKESGESTGFIESIDSICQKYNIQNYTVNEDGSIDVDGSVYLNNEKLTKLPLKFRHVGGYFNCSNNQLTSLEGAPQTVGRYFDCHNNQLTSLEGGPQTVGYAFNCENNQLTSLKGGPQTVVGHFYCDNNQLTSLDGAPQTVGGSFFCHDNQLTSLEGAPQTVGGGFYCDSNQLTSLEGGPSYVKGDFNCNNNPLLVRLTNEILDIGGSLYLSNTPLEVLWNNVLDGNIKFLDYLNTQPWNNVFPEPKTMYEDYFLGGIEEYNIEIPDNWKELLKNDGWKII
jgi:hypothetical protein